MDGSAWIEKKVISSIMKQNPKINISEIFYSIQGEGLYAGEPSVFIRLSGCPLRCVWCDTPYTSWNPEVNMMTVDEVVAKVSNLGSKTTPIVITGGEPFAQPHALRALCEALREYMPWLTIETAGAFYHPDLDIDMLAISPKTSNSIPQGTEMEKQHVRWLNRADDLKKLTGAYPAFLKFVVRGESDMPEILRIVEPLEDDVPIYLMPEGATQTVQDQHKKAVAELCKKYGFRYSPRLHIDLWNDKRGV